MSLVNYIDMRDMTDGRTEIDAAIAEYEKNNGITGDSPLLRARRLAHCPDGITHHSEVDMLALAYKDGSIVYVDPSIHMDIVRDFCAEVEKRASRPAVAMPVPKKDITKLFHDIGDYHIRRLNAEGVEKTKRPKEEPQIDFDD